MRFVEGPTRLYEAHYRFVVCSWYPKQVSDFSFEIEINTSDTGVSISKVYNYPLYIFLFIFNIDGWVHSG